MSASYIRYMNSPFWDFVADMGGSPHAEHHLDRAHYNRGRVDPLDWTAFGPPSAEHSWQHNFPHRPHPRGHWSHHGSHGPRGYAHDGPEAGREATHIEPQSEHEDADMTPATQDTIGAEGRDTRDAPDPEISTPDGLQDEEKDTSDISESGEERCRGCRHRNGTHRGRRGGRGGRGMFEGRRRGPHGPHGPHEHAEHSQHHGGPWAHSHGHRHGHGHIPGRGFAHGAGPLPWGGFAGHRSRHGSWNRHGGPGLDEFMHRFTNDPRLHGLGDLFSNAMRAAAAALKPEGQETGIATLNPNDNNGPAGQASASQSGNKSRSHTGNPDVDFYPAADIYDTPDMYIVHLALPGAKDEDINLNLNADQNELRVAGVIAREGDESTLQTLALAERNVGVFERTIKLGVKKVYAGEISARMENGLLVVKVPKKQEEESWTEIMVGGMNESAKPTK